MNNIDANVALRVGRGEVSSKFYVQSVQYATEGGRILQPVVAEMFFICKGKYQVELGREDAIARGHLPVYKSSPREYSRKLAMPAKWMCNVYMQLDAIVDKLIKEYPIEFEDYALVQKTIDIGEEFGFDWVDSLLLARYDLYGEQPLSRNKNIEQGMKVLLLAEEEDGDSPDVDSMHLV